VGEIVGLALQGVIFGAGGGLCDKGDIILRGDEIITAQGRPYVFKPLQVVQPRPNGKLSCVAVPVFIFVFNCCFEYGNICPHRMVAWLLLFESSQIVSPLR